jgi:hypothetical protein
LTGGGIHVLKAFVTDKPLGEVAVLPLMLMWHKPLMCQEEILQLGVVEP